MQYTSGKIYKKYQEGKWGDLSNRPISPYWWNGMVGYTGRFVYNIFGVRL